MRTRPSAILLAAALAAASACSASEVPAAGGTDKITYLTSFNTFGRDAYAYVALEKGYFSESRLDVTINPGSATVEVLKLVASGRADFGVGDFTATVITAAKEKLPVTTVAMVHQKSLSAIVTLADRRISKPADLVGKRIGDQPGSTNQVMFPIYAKAAGIDPAKVEFVPAAPPALPQLLVSGQVDGIGQFVVGTPLIEKAAQGRKVSALPYGDLLPDLYGNALVTSKDLPARNPDLVKRFRAALLKGLQYSIDHPEETGEILRKHQPTQDPVVAAAEVTLMGPAVRPAGGPIGSVDELRVQKTIQLLTEANAIPEGSIATKDIVAGS
ncbi:NitT/TauT family transport system substrate-binding protein [Kibdelosporangium banguiense]|uniref:Thiamine pyrimidine synthase n=1 Tax=Kibdelosporangium banguiense TaxID=1365924 RepID=A0ABS4U0X9_9PSEU|nr:ABC transporter substrate-binding protein [Kibdelosporangium banguiense]MBP2330302.1 NitT/TauT family transport system substrate-binding protein [Kibdelosporangium banguiense]